MPFGLRWPFQRKPSTMPDRSSAATPAESLNVQRTPDAIDAAFTPDLGAELMERASLFSTPPTLGESGGLSIAQSVSAAADFIQRLPLTTSSMLDVTSLPDVNEFVASLPALSSFANLESAPVLMGELPAPSGLTDELPPLGSLPAKSRRQLPGMIGVAPEIDVASPRPLEPSIDRTGPVVPSIGFITPGVSELTQSVAAPGEPIALPPTPIDHGSSIESPLPLNNFAAPLPLISVPQEVGNVEAPIVPPITPMEVASPIESARSEITASRPWPELPQELSAPAPVDELPGDQSTSASEPSLTISRYAEELPLPDLIEREAPQPPVTPSIIELSIPTLSTVVEPLPLVNKPEELAPSSSPVGETRSVREAPPELIAPHEIAAPPIGEPPTSVGIPAGEPSISISRYAEELPLIDLNIGSSAPTMGASAWIETPSIGETAPEVMASPEMTLPSIGEAIAEARSEAREAPMTISRAAAETPSPRTTGAVPVQRMSLFGGLGGLTQNLPSLGGLTQSLPSLGGLSENLPSLGGLTENLPSLGGLTQNLPSLGGLTENLPSLGGLTGSLSSLGGLTENLPSLGGLAEQLPSLGGLTSPEMPLPTSLSGALGGLGGAAQEAMGQITSMAPSMPEMPQMPQLPSIDKLTDQIWRQIQNKLKVERERTRGLA